MICEKYELRQSGSAEYASMYTYIQTFTDSINIVKRPMVVICPGGAYAYTSDREAEPIALSFCAMGYHAAVVRYTTAPDGQFPTALMELAEAVKIIREHASEWHVDENKIIIGGASAGGHLVGSLGCFWNKPFLKCVAPAEMIKPNGLILIYPVITMGEYTHEMSRENIFGKLEDATAFGGKELIDFLSLEKQVSNDVPPCFIWTTFEDNSVPAENSLMFVNALRKANVNTEFHMFPHGGHGYSLANELTTGIEGKEIQPEAAEWINLAKNWLRSNYPITHI